MVQKAKGEGGMNWTPVAKANPCPICLKSDWCRIGERVVHCKRIESAHPGKTEGWYHTIGDTTKLRPLPPRAEKPVTIDAAAIMREFDADTWPEMLEQLAESLGVTMVSLDLLGVAWAPGLRLFQLRSVSSPDQHAWAVPMRDWQGNIVGIRLRLLDGRKRGVTGSHNGLFYAEGDAHMTYLTEGESDTAAALSIGLDAVGRPGCMGLELECDRLLMRKRARSAVIIADCDEPDKYGIVAGTRGAGKLQAALSVPSVIYYPPAKDLRKAVQAGLTAAMIESATSSMIWTQPKRG